MVNIAFKICISLEDLAVLSVIRECGGEGDL